MNQVMNVPTDIEQMMAEGRIIEVADQIGRNAGRIDFLECNVYGAGIEKWRQTLKHVLAKLDDLLVVTSGGFSRLRTEKVAELNTNS